jgi:hypothetical protein
MTRAFAVAVVIVVAPTLVELAVKIVPKAASKGVVALTPVNATIEPTASLTPLPNAKLKLLPSVPSTTLYKTEPCLQLMPRSEPSIKVQPERKASVVLQ